MTREPDFYKSLSKTFRGDDKNIYQIFGAQIGDAKTTTKSTVPPISTSDKISPKVIY